MFTKTLLGDLHWNFCFFYLKGLRMGSSGIFKPQSKNKNKAVQLNKITVFIYFIFSKKHENFTQRNNLR
jgi:hypothetical protein